MKNIMGFRMRTVEDVIAEIVDLEDDNVYHLKKPCVPVPMPGPNGETGGGGTHFMKWQPYADPDAPIVIYFEDFVGDPYEPWAELQTSYLEITSGIAIAPASTLIKT